MIDRKATVVVALLGLCGTVAASWALGGSIVGAVKLAAAASGAAAGAGIVALLLLRRARGCSIATQGVLVSLAPLAAVAAGTMAASHWMMVSARPVAALGLVLTAAGTVGVVTSLMFGASVRAGSVRLIDAARQIGGGDLAPRIERPPVEEMAALASELERMAFRLEQGRQRARELEDARRELVAWISHDLRTPLHRLRAIVDALEDGIVTGDEIPAYYERLRVESTRAASLLSDLFELNRITVGELQLEIEPVELETIVSETVASFAVVAQGREITLRTHPNSGGALVEASTMHLERAIGNLLDNALRYTHSGGMVDVTTGTETSCASVSIEDSCGGHDLALVEQLLADDTSTQELGRAGRSGLGLAIAKGLLQAQRGALKVAATERGCRFTIELPLAAPPALLIGTNSSL